MCSVVVTMYRCAVHSEVQNALKREVFTVTDLILKVFLLFVLRSTLSVNVLIIWLIIRHNHLASLHTLKEYYAAVSVRPKSHAEQTGRSPAETFFKNPALLLLPGREEVHGLYLFICTLQRNCRETLRKLSFISMFHWFIQTNAAASLYSLNSSLGHRLSLSLSLSLCVALSSFPLSLSFCFSLSFSVSLSLCVSLSSLLLPPLSLSLFLSLYCGHILNNCWRKLKRTCLSSKGSERNNSPYHLRS